MRSRLSLLIALALAAWPPAAGADNWPQFRGPDGNSLSAAKKLPTQWAEGKNVAWKVKVPGIAWSQPITWGDKVFVTTAVTDKPVRPGAKYSTGFDAPAKPPDVPYRWQVLCLDLATGKPVWEKTVREGKPNKPIHPNNSYASETPATDGERLIAYFGMTGLYCLDLSGKVLWSKDLGAYPTQFNWGSASSPVLYGDRVYVQCDNEKASFLVALDKRTGDELWRVDRKERSNWSTPYVWKNKKRTELITAGGTRMRSYDPASGELLWEMAGSGRTATTPVGDEDLLYVDSYDWLAGQTGVLAAVRAGASGDVSLKAGQTTSDAVAWSIKLKYFREASPLLYQGCLYVLEQHNAVLHCYDAKTGKEHFRERMPGTAGFVACPWAGGGKVYCMDNAGLTAVLEPGPRFQVVETNALDGGMFWASPAVADGRLLLRSVDHLYCIAE
jgi:outer membrane protein assembly factor BamB